MISTKKKWSASVFGGLEPGNARKGKMLLSGFILVNCRIFSRALTLALSHQADPGDPIAILGLLNDMRPTKLELDTNWTDLKRKYPKAGSEPVIPESISADEIQKVILEKLLANETDINNFEKEINKMSYLTGWRHVGWEHISIFEEEGLDKVSGLVRRIMEVISESEPADKFSLFDPVEELF